MDKFTVELTREQVISIAACAKGCDMNRKCEFGYYILDRKRPNEDTIAFEKAIINCYDLVEDVLSGEREEE